MTVKEQGGILLAIFALASMGMWFAEMNFRLFFWIDFWGPVVGWVIRVSMLVLGIYIYKTGDEIE